MFSIILIKGQSQIICLLAMIMLAVLQMLALNITSLKRYCNLKD